MTEHWWTTQAAALPALMVLALLAGILHEAVGLLAALVPAVILAGGIMTCCALDGRSAWDHA